jgi:hypothetical protein
MGAFCRRTIQEDGYRLFSRAGSCCDNESSHSEIVRRSPLRVDILRRYVRLSGPAYSKNPYLITDNKIKRAACSSRRGAEHDVTNRPVQFFAFRRKRREQRVFPDEQHRSLETDGQPRRSFRGTFRDVVKDRI